MDHLIGIPYVADGRDAHGCDCWGLIRLYFRDVLGVDLPSYDGAMSAGDRHQLAGIISGEAGRDWSVIDGPDTPGDVALMRRGSAACHVGVFIGAGLLLHTEPAIASAIERVASPMVRSRIVSWHRWSAV